MIGCACVWVCTRACVCVWFVAPSIHPNLRPWLYGKWERSGRTDGRTIPSYQSLEIAVQCKRLYVRLVQSGALFSKKSKSDTVSKSRTCCLSPHWYAQRSFVVLPYWRLPHSHISGLRAVCQLKTLSGITVYTGRLLATVMARLQI